MSEQYRVILADPPWDYRAWNPKTSQRYVGNQYRTMTPERIQALPLAADNCALFLWATMPTLPQALTTMAAWGFDYRTVAFTWVKTTKAGTPSLGMGFYTRANAELCLLGIRGVVKRKAKDVPQVILSSRRQHSRKPDEQYDRIMRLFAGPYLELFARQQWPGWDVWGDEAGKFPAQPFLIGEEAIA